MSYKTHGRTEGSFSCFRNEKFYRKNQDLIEESLMEGSTLTLNGRQVGFTPGQTLLEVADLSTVWVEAAIYEAEAPFIRVGTAGERFISLKRDSLLW